VFRVQQRVKVLDSEGICQQGHSGLGYQHVNYSGSLWTFLLQSIHIDLIMSLREYYNQLWQRVPLLSFIFNSAFQSLHCRNLWPMNILQALKVVSIQLSIHITIFPPNSTFSDPRQPLCFTGLPQFKPSQMSLNWCLKVDPRFFWISFYVQARTWTRSHIKSDDLLTCSSVAFNLKTNPN
jgi:hypothetical protein